LPARAPSEATHAARPKPLVRFNGLGPKLNDCGRTPPPAPCGQHAPPHPGPNDETMKVGLWAANLMKLDRPPDLGIIIPANIGSDEAGIQPTAIYG
jgi:hypothetical protein